MRILVVDDEVVARVKLDRLFSEYGSCECASNGREAIALFEKAVREKNPFELIALDVELPDISGLDLLNHFCAEETRLNVPVARKFMVTGNSETKTGADAGKYRYDAYIVKPCWRADIAERMKALNLGQRQATEVSD